MRRFPRFSIALVSISLIMGCSSGTSEADLQSIRDFVAQLDAAINAGDLDALMALYSDSVIQMPPNEPLIQGKDALRARTGDWFAIYNAESWSTVEYARVMGDRAFVRLSYVESATPKVEGEGAAFSVKGKWVVMLASKPDGSWQITNEIWNEDAPPDSS